MENWNTVICQKYHHGNIVISLNYHRGNIVMSGNYHDGNTVLRLNYYPGRTIIYSDYHRNTLERLWYTNAIVLTDSYWSTRGWPVQASISVYVWHGKIQDVSQRCSFRNLILAQDSRQRCRPTIFVIAEASPRPLMEWKRYILKPFISWLTPLMPKHGIRLWCRKTILVLQRYKSSHSIKTFVLQSNFHIISLTMSLNDW